MPVASDRVWRALSIALALALMVTTVLLVQRDTVAAVGGEPAEAGTGDVGAEQVIEVSLTEFALQPAEISAAPDRPIRFEIRNIGAIEHDFSIAGVDGTTSIPGGGTATLAVEPLEPGEYHLLCTVAGHEPAGMSGTLTVADTAGGEEAAETVTTSQTTSADHTGAGEDHSAMSPEEMARLHEEGVKKFPVDSKGRGNQPMEPVIADDGTKVFELTADEIDWETKPGVVKEGMAYNGQIPGPRIEVDLGDRVRIVLHNELEEPTAMHSHGLIVPNGMDGVPGLNQPSIMPGESFTYEFEVRNSGSHMYHSHFNSAEQVTKGLLGAFIVYGDDEPDVALDYTMIMNDGPLGFTLNGKDFPATEPLVVDQGDTVRIRYMNEGFQIHPMHLHGIPQQVIAKDGYPLPQPYTADTIMVAPGERVDVLVEATEPGPWAFHCHILTHAEAADGMFGMVTAMIVQ